MKFLRRVFGRHGPTIYNDENDGEYYDAQTQEMIFSSFDLLERLQNVLSLDSERIISHFFVGEDDNIRRSSGLFRDLGFLIGIQESNRLQIVERAIVSADWIERTIPLMCRTSGEFELEYDGWDCGRIIGPSDEIIIT